MNMNFSQLVLAWYDRHGRKSLPWQQDRNAYRVWLSEIMLQQTRVSTVIPYFERFTQRFPGISELADAKVDEVMRMWAGLGYYARARNAHRCAQQIRDEYGGVFPDSQHALESLPGIGRSTAGAIRAQAFGQRGIVLDGNVRRVLARYFAVPGWPGEQRTLGKLWSFAEELTPDRRCADYAQAMMDLGAMVCTRSSPKCDRCPVSAGCLAHHQGDPQAYPGKRPRARLPTREVFVMLCTMKESDVVKVLLERRPPSGIWGGLWSLPEEKSEVAAVASLRDAYGCEVEHVRQYPAFRHTFTHFHLHIRPLEIQVRCSNQQVQDSSVRWCSADDIEAMGLPRPIAGLVSDFYR